MAKELSPDLSRFRNLGIIAHIDAGKTTTTEHLLYYSGAIHRLGSVDTGDTETDYDVEEQERGITIYSACVPFRWRDCTINLIDTPGFNIFTNDVRQCLIAADSCLTVVDGVGGYRADVLEPVPGPDDAHPLARESESYYVFEDASLRTVKKVFMGPSRGLLSDEFWTMPGLGALYSRAATYVVRAARLDGRLFEVEVEGRRIILGRQSLHGLRGERLANPSQMEK